MRRTVVTSSIVVILAAVIGLRVSGGADPGAPLAVTAQVVARTDPGRLTPALAQALPPCEFDDGTPPAGSTVCHWDARARGNGLGTSFVSIDGPDGKIVHLPS